MKQQCKICGRNSESEYCFKHKQKKPLKNNVSRKETASKLDKMKLFFLDIWKNRKHNSEVSGKFLGKEPLSTFFHHILPKSKYPEAAYDDDNIILLTWEEHDFVERDSHKYEEVNKRREQLKLKYGID